MQRVMRRRWAAVMQIVGAMAVALCYTIALPAAERPAANTRPNIIFILCDDLGYGDVGVLFQNSRAAANNRAKPWHSTPQLDTFAREGLQLQRHYCPAPVCVASRASLLTGVHQGTATARDNQFDKALENNYTLASVLKKAGYATAAIGKWGLQGNGDHPTQWPAYPTKRGFDDYFGYVRHMDGHWHYPKEDKREIWENNAEVSKKLDLCYTADLFTARAKKWITDHRKKRPSEPFFLYLAYDTPHAMLQLPPTRYPSGGGLKGGVQWLGKPGAMLNTAKGKYDSYVHPDYANATWDHDNNPATPEQPWPAVFKRFAASVRRIDDAVGDLRQLLQDLGIDQNTLVVFTSDNGPHIEDYLKVKPHYAANFFDNYGPFDGIKRDLWEGGVRMATLARWPGHIPAGSASTAASGSWDWMATFADLAGVTGPASSDGVSLVPTLTGVGKQRPSTIYIEYFVQGKGRAESGGKTPDYSAFTPAHRGRTRNQMQVIHTGGYKGVRYDIKSHADNFEIYDVLKDPKEANNLAMKPDFAALQQQMKDRVLQVRRPNASATRPYDNELIPPANVEGTTPGVLDYAVFEGPWPWVPDFDAMTPVKTGRVAGLDLAVRPRDENVGIKFRGYVEIPRDGEYTFYLTSDSGAALRIHDARVIDDDFNHDGSEVSASIRLRAGRHPIRLFYRHATGPCRLELSYSGPELAKQPVPVSAWSAAGPSRGVSVELKSNTTATKTLAVDPSVEEALAERRQLSTD